MSNNNIEDTANSLLSEFGDDSDTQRRVKNTESQNLNIQLKREIFGFFTDRINRVTDQEKLREKLETELLSDVESGELSFDQKFRLYIEVSKQNNSVADSLLSIFRPTNGAPSVLADSIAREGETGDVFDQLYDKFSSDQIQQLGALEKVLTKVINNPNQFRDVSNSSDDEGSDDS